MATRDTTQLALGTDAEHGKYLVRSPVDVIFILREILKQNALLTLHLPRSSDVILTSLLAVDIKSGKLVMDYGADPGLCRQALAAGQLICTTVHYQVKVQFRCEDLSRIRFDGRDAFSARLPETLLRLQRREDFRVAMPLTRPVKCVIPLPSGAGRVCVEVTVLDISSSGIAVIDHHSGIALEPGEIYSDCRLDLPEIGTITFTMRVKDAFAFTLRNGLACRRTGCEFVAMPGSTAALIRRYIIGLERARNARLKGLV